MAVVLLLDDRPEDSCDVLLFEAAVDDEQAAAAVISSDRAKAKPGRQIRPHDIFIFTCPHFLSFSRYYQSAGFQDW